MVFATNNAHKLGEVGAMLGGKVELVSAAEAGITEEIPETGNTLEENALQKARYVWKRVGGMVFADDSGLEVEALGGEPGVYSARYAQMAGEGSGPEGEGTYEDNNRLLLKRLKEAGKGSGEGAASRRARFKTVIAFITEEGEERLFEGVVEGRITEAAAGEGGFGYDPIFAPEGAGGQTFAQMSAEEKNQMSHRAKSVKKFDSCVKNFDTRQI